ncbi:simple sugar transport system permease protein [Lachnospiraceae bacterium XBB1006]|nr:simple sugar transport system permease protein [Lachnospiraceae bacterium XBB1006]
MNKKNTESFWTSEGFMNFVSAILAIVAGLLIGFILLLVSDSANAAEGFSAILQGGFSSGMNGIGKTLYIATPIILTGLSVGFAFKTGLFNIGASGQFTAGAFVAIYIGVKWTGLGGAHWIVGLLAAVLIGAIFGLIPGLLKAYFNVNEVITCIMMNYIGMYATNLLIRKNIYDQVRNRTMAVKSTADVPSAGIGEFFGNSSANLGIVIAIIAVIVVYVVLNKTTFGYELKACGKNKEATKYAGINSKRDIVLSMVIAGALSGLGGALLYLSGSGKFIQVVDVIANEGFTGISVALLGMSNPIGVLFAGLFIAHITVGGGNMQLCGYPPEVVDIITASIIYCGALSLLIKLFINKVKMARKKGDK